MCWFPSCREAGDRLREGAGAGRGQAGRVIDYNHRRTGAATDPQSLGTPGRRSTLFRLPEASGGKRSNIYAAASSAVISLSARSSGCSPYAEEFCAYALRGRNANRSDRQLSATNAIGEMSSFVATLGQGFSVLRIVRTVLIARMSGLQIFWGLILVYLGLADALSKYRSLPIAVGK